jgi:hypothetical protein
MFQNILGYNYSIHFHRLVILIFSTPCYLISLFISSLCMPRTSSLCGRSRGPLDLYFISLFLYSSVIPTIPETCCF